MGQEQDTAHSVSGVRMQAVNNANQANSMATLLHDRLCQFPEIMFLQKVETNALFLTMPKHLIAELHKKWSFYFWNEEEGEIRLVTSFDTKEKDIDDFIDSIRRIIA